MANNKDKVNDELLYALINKGGSVPKEMKPATGKKTYDETREYFTQIITYQLRMPRWLAKQIDDKCKESSPVYHSRHGWIMDAIISKLAKKR
jgi:hypothetical protein